jgi:TIR domain
MVPYAFLSLASEDDEIVSTVFRYLPAGLAFFYKKSFQTGEEMLAEMERGIDNSAIFALFVSPASLQSHWVVVS